MIRGSLVVVGTGIRLAQQCTPEARQHICRADIVYAMAGDPIVLSWLRALNAATVSLHDHYVVGRDRGEIYEAITEVILGGVRAGKAVCAAFYGHPGVFVTPSYAAIARARTEGFEAVMLPGVSAEDCLLADLELDSASFGRQSYDATDFLVHARRFDPTAALILWQIAAVGEHAWGPLTSSEKRLRLLADVLSEYYPSDHPAVVYQAATLPTGRAKTQRLELGALERARLSQESTLFIPPLAPPAPDLQRWNKVRAALE